MCKGKIKKKRFEKAQKRGEMKKSGKFEKNI